MPEPRLSREPFEASKLEPKRINGLVAGAVDRLRALSVNNQSGAVNLLHFNGNGQDMTEFELSQRTVRLLFEDIALTDCFSQISGETESRPHSIKVRRIIPYTETVSICHGQIAYEDGSWRIEVFAVKE